MFSKITKEEFNRSAFAELFNDKLTSRCWGVITNGVNGFKFGWQSDLLEPFITEADTNIHTIGIDRNFVIVDLDKGKILLSLNLTYNFFTTILFKGNIFVCTELEIIKVTQNGLKILSSYPLPDFFEELVLSDDSIKVKCFEQDVIALK